ncbi:Alpha/beta-hydrolase [Trichophyton interdigitale]|uniref:Alpha/beta-hydrolase n=4 Tax=Trichophyton TaxID=5550 RepID=A0A9P5CVN7_9EURO|nr:hypothetical protein TESG_05617 [Trichophyton tonsurans CBS 112818]EGE03241.1 hypothetical protein TEQG_02279 [Trichophyton equinum CBS 127.97]KAF3895509.1 Alpha/beta-hydrolase [Trichophyton interdigitale]KDB27704.1 hypothetical protein H109_00524 [Trichophyton interdigitale MR816]KAG5208349.1 Alpha/beta-hydrolase [Trichophyton interdigitale]
MTKPTIAVVPGAWIPEQFYSPYIHTLEKAGFETRYAEYPSLEPQNPLTADCATDAKAVRSILEPLVETEGKDVVLVMHSYGSMPGCAAAKGLSKTERLRSGKLGGILGMILFSAFLVPEGLSCAGIQGGMLPPWIMLDNPAPGLNVPKDPINVFAADFDQGLAKKTEQELKPHSSLAFFSPQPPTACADPAFKDRLAYVVATNDLAVPKDAQYAMIAGTGQEWKIKEVPQSHCAPFKVDLDESVKIVGEFIEAFQGV